MASGNNLGQFDQSFLNVLTHHSTLFFILKNNRGILYTQWRLAYLILLNIFLVSFCVTSTSMSSAYWVHLSELCDQSLHWGHLSWSVCRRKNRKKAGKEWAAESHHTGTCIGTAHKRPPIASDSAAPCWEQRDWSWITKTSAATSNTLDMRSYNSAVNRPRSACWRYLILIQNKEVHFGWGGGGLILGSATHTFKRSPGPQSCCSWWYLHLQRPPIVIRLFSHAIFFPSCLLP